LITERISSSETEPANRRLPDSRIILKQCESLSLDDIAQTAPSLELWQGAQDRLYSRLFQS